MAWEPTTTERELELILFGAMLGGKASSELIAKTVGEFGMYQSNVNDLIACVRRAMNGEKPLNENPYFQQWCKRNGVAVNGSVVESLAKVVNENGKRRATNRAVTEGNYGYQLRVDNALGKMNARLKEIENS